MVSGRPSQPKPARNDSVPDLGISKPNKQQAKTLLWTLGLAVFVVLLACIFNCPAGAQDRMFLDYANNGAVEDSNGLSIVEPLVTEDDGETPWTVSAHCSNRSAFKLFGSLASDDPVCGASVSYERSGYKIYAHATEEVGRHDPSILFGSYYGTIGTKEWDRGPWTYTVGVEYFHSDQRATHQFTFIAPLWSVARDLDSDWTVTLGGQYVGSYHTEYSGERIYGYADLEYSHDVGRWTLGSSGGYIAGNEGRSTFYVEPSLEYNFSSGLTATANALWAHTEEGSSVITVPCTVTAGFSYDF